MAGESGEEAVGVGVEDGCFFVEEFEIALDVLLSEVFGELSEAVEADEVEFVCFFDGGFEVDAVEVKPLIALFALQHFSVVVVGLLANAIEDSCLFAGSASA